MGFDNIQKNLDIVKPLQYVYCAFLIKQENREHNELKQVDQRIFSAENPEKSAANPAAEL